MTIEPPYHMRSLIPTDPRSSPHCLVLKISITLISQVMQKDEIDIIRKTISEYREALFAAMLNKHYTHAALYIKCMIACVPSELKLEATEAPEANPTSNESATDYAKRLFKWIDATLPAIERKIAYVI
ncbi:MAG TPA: hypothetical protein VKA87_08265 [Nitrososphaeraceae archaeon]|nr:hypothetical protein [Nitrososphaeraceae archaeon]